MTIEVRRVQDLETGDVDYFVVNEGLNLRINGICLDRAVAAGLLPDFAVIELEHSSFFWWRTAAALDYVPVRGSRFVYWLFEVVLTSFLESQAQT